MNIKVDRPLRIVTEEKPTEVIDINGRRFVAEVEFKETGNPYELEIIYHLIRAIDGELVIKLGGDRNEQ